VFSLTLQCQETTLPTSNQTASGLKFYMLSTPIITDLTGLPLATPFQKEK